VIACLMISFSDNIKESPLEWVASDFYWKR
jgi:hypothetical protein